MIGDACATVISFSDRNFLLHRVGCFACYGSLAGSLSCLVRYLYSVTKNAVIFDSSAKV